MSTHVKSSITFIQAKQTVLDVSIFILYLIIEKLCFT